ncbi:double-strand break repair protein AddB [Palleronia sp. KMU-117]|uniref:double-strand break repair protein AddB n=1 Tax=Palleronia sp. KMU-117 TaxID=3434108 RepID=UPI003D73B6A8
MFEPTPAPRVFGMPPGVDFPRALARGLIDRLRDAPPEALARVEIIVNTERMGRRLSELFAQMRPGLLPRITPVARLPDRFPTPGLPSRRAPLRRKLDLARLIGALLDIQPDLAPRHAVHSLADGLADLFDEVLGEGVSPDAVLALPVDDMSGHWTRSLTFLRIVRDYLETADGDAQDDAARNRATVAGLAARWALNPPETPVIVAGSTGSRGTTAMLMQAVARLPQGALVLPGFDFCLPDDVWAALGPEAEDHPQARFARLLSGLGLPPRAVARWNAETGDALRNALVSLALRPAPVTDQWLRDGPGLGPLGRATDALSLIEAPSPRIEAQAIALCLRKAAEDGQTAALVSPDRTLTRQVTAALGRWGIEPDDSAGRPLALSAPGRLLRHVAGLIGRRMTSQDLIVLLKHPLVATGAASRGGHLLLTRELELHLRKTWTAFPDAGILRHWAEDRDDRTRALVDWIVAALDGLAELRAAPLGALLDHHVAVAEALAAGPGGGGSGGLWQKQPGEAARAAIDDLRAAATAQDEMTVADYRALLDSVLQSREVRDPVAPHAGIMIWGTLEARVQGADLVILGGLNDGVWPEHPAPDPWLNRAMRRQVGLLLPERNIGLSAHDFQQAIAAKEVVLSRARRDADSETVPSRWLNRLTNLLSGLPDQGGPEALGRMRARGARWVRSAVALEHRAAPVPAAPRPSPRPPVEARPRKLSVTEIERLLRDPYAIYARRVLGLRRLDALSRAPDAALRGTVMHEIVERMLIAIRDGRFDPTAPEAAGRISAIAEAVLDELVPWPATRRLWRGRFLRVVPRLLDGEARRLAEGVPFPPEREGTLVFADLGFALTGKADRIDRRHDGTLAIYDYKTGGVPAEKVVRFFNRQLPLEAVMAESGAFEGVPAETVTILGYIALGPSASDRAFAPADEYGTGRVGAELRNLVTAYRDRARGYTSRRAVATTTFDGDFDQLARFGEWDESDPPAGEDVG